MKKIWLLATVMSLTPGLGLAQTMDELLNDGKNTDNVLTQSMGLSRQNYSPLNKINKGNVKRLVPVWSTSLQNEMGELAAPVVYDGVMYVINGSWTIAINVETGQQIWRTPVQIEPGMTRRTNAFNRGAPAIYNGKLFRVTVDNHLVALEMKTGRVLWDQKFADWKEGYYATGAPIVANGVLISGMSGGELTTRGFLDGWDPDTGRKLWRRYTIPAPRPGRPTAMPGNTAAARPGAQAPTTRSSISSIGARAMRSRTTRARARDAIASSHRACSQSGRRPARSCVTTSIRRMTCTTWTPPTNTCSPISRSTGRCAR
jgi:alcohol dehydrogenase (cytochrome c)